VRFVRAVGRVARWLAYTAAVAAVLIALAFVDDGWNVLWGAVAAIPAVVLFLFSLALFELAELPDRIRNAPAQAGEVRRAVEELRRARGTRLPRALWGAGKVAADTRALATPWAPIVPLVSMPFLAATLASAVATPFVLVLGLVLLAVA
jgi:hypothetical protein